MQLTHRTEGRDARIRSNYVPVPKATVQQSQRDITASARFKFSEDYKAAISSAKDRSCAARNQQTASYVAADLTAPQLDCVLAVKSSRMTGRQVGAASSGLSMRQANSALMGLQAKGYVTPEWFKGIKVWTRTDKLVEGVE
jgi:hypothetical protein